MRAEQSRQTSAHERRRNAGSLSVGGKEKERERKDGGRQGVSDPTAHEGKEGVLCVPP